MTFFEVFDRWLEEHKAEVKDTTFAKYRFDRNTFTKVIDADTDICSLDEIKMKGVFETFCELQMSSHYRTDLLMVFRMVMRYADKNLGISNLPSINWKVKREKDSRKNPAKQRIKRFTMDEYERIIKVFESNPTPGGLAIVVTMFTGIRIGEACGLKFSDLDSTRGSYIYSVHVCQ